VSKNINIRMTADMARLVRERAAGLKVSESEYAGIIFGLGWKSLTSALAELESTQKQEEANEISTK